MRSGHLVYLLVSQDDDGQLRLHPEEAVQFGLSQWEATPVGGVHHINQNVSPSQVVGPVPPQILPSADCSTENTNSHNHEI